MSDSVLIFRFLLIVDTYIFLQTNTFAFTCLIESNFLKIRLDNPSDALTSDTLNILAT